MNAISKARRVKPEWVVVRAFAAAVLAGALVLCLPFCSRSGAWTPPLTALFTATSATCVTGLSVVDIADHFSRAGQWVILGMIQVGGLGIMTFGTFLLIAVGRRLGLQEEFVLINSMGFDRIRGLPSLLKRAFFFTVLFELAGTAIVATRLHGWHGFPLPEALYSAFFHSVSAFCNAGFSLQPESLILWREDPVILLTLAALVVLGGIGFLVLHDLSSIRFWRRDLIKRGRLALHTRIVLKTSAILIVAGWALFAWFEWGRTLAPLGMADKAVVALFHSVTPRTAGFNAVDMALVHPATLWVTLMLMFIGGSPCSTAGGIKTTTIAVLFRVALAMITGRREVESHGRTIPAKAVREGLAIFMLSAALVAVAFIALLLIENPPVLSASASAADELLFEAVSAFATVGLSTGITPFLSEAGRLVIILLMFIGRVGPLTLTLTLGRRGVRQAVRFPEEEVIVG
jgi:trk system potassium uptake protein TrkH